LDEPLEGLAPIIVEELLAALRRITRDEGLSAIIVEQNARKLLPITDRVVVLERGRIVYAADSASLSADPSKLEAWLAVSDGSH
jgi:branched-chain amino acid transport system ATP-binding protein